MRILEEQTAIPRSIVAFGNRKKIIRPLKFLMRIFTLDRIEREVSISENRWSIINKVIAAFILGILNFFSLSYKFNYIYNRINISVRLTDSLQMTYDYCQFIVDLYCVHKFGRDVSVEYMKQFERLDRILHITEYEAMQTRLNKLLLIFAIIWLITALLDFISWYVTYGWVTPTVYAVAYIFLLVKMLTNLDMMSNVINLEWRLGVVANIVQNLYKALDHKSIKHESLSPINDELFNKNWNTRTINRHTTRKETSNPLDDMSNVDKVEWLTRCYLMLNEQCMFINNLYGLRILLNSLSLLIDMVRYANVACRLIMQLDRGQTYIMSYFPVAASVTRLLACAVVLFTLVFHCEQNYRLCDKIIDLITHVQINKNTSTELLEALSDLRNLIEQRPIAFTTAKFFTLNYGFLVATASAVATYTVILLESLD